jgi:polysaccharide pyruvyl transferase WcaK-like protein
MNKPKIHILHVGDMTNKGTEALIRSDVATLHEIFDEVSISVSTTDIEGVKDVGMNCEVMPVMIDIPYKIADSFGGKNLSRTSLLYKIYAGLGLIIMFIQTALLFISSAFVKIGLPGFYRRKLINRIKNCDIIISGSDENFKEAASLLPTNIYWKITWWSILFKRSMEMVISKFFGKPTIMFPNSIGPFKSPFGKYLARLAFNNMDTIIIREPVSWEILESLKVPTEKHQTSDAALLYKPRGTPPEDVVTRPTLCVCTGVYSQTLSPEKMKQFITDHAKTIDFAISKLDLDVVLMPHYITGFELDDLEVSNLIYEQVENKNRTKIVEVSTLDEFKHRLNYMDLLISSKMHPAVLGVSGFVPTLCIAYDHKQIGFFNILGMPECLIEINDVSSENLINILENIDTNKEELREKLHNKIPELQKVIRETMETSLFKLLKIERE